MNSQDVIVLIKDFMNHHHEFPSSKMLRKLKNHYLDHLIQKLGGYNFFRRLLALPVKRRWTKKDITDELFKLVNKLGYFPTQKELKELDSSLKAAVLRYGGINYYRKILNHATVKNPIDYNIEKIQQELLPFVNNNKMPTQQTLQSHNQCRLVEAIRRYGGIRKVADELGLACNTGYVATDGHFVNSAKELLVDEYLFKKQIPHEVGGLIAAGRRFRFDFKIADIYVELWGYKPNETSKLAKIYHKRRAEKEKFYKDNNLKYISIECDLFAKPYSKIITELDILLSGLTCREQTSPIVNIIKHSYYWSYDKTLSELNYIIEKLGCFPSKEELSKINCGLCSAMKKYGGFNYFRNLLNYPLLRRARWTEEELIDELRVLSKQIGDFPTTNQLMTMKKSSIVAEIRRFGGFNKFQDLLGYKPKHRMRANAY